MKQVTVGLSTHRPEMLPLIAGSMKNHDAIFLEEPPTTGFRQMLNGAMEIEDYLFPIDSEYPAYSRHMCLLLQKLHQGGKHIYQVEPFIKNLIEIHDFFAQGHGPENLIRDSIQFRIYLAEKNATGALLNYYKTVMTGSFDDTIEAVRSFARSDAVRFRLRDRLRAQALTPRLNSFESSYIEAGEIHYGLWSMLREIIPNGFRVRPSFIADTAIKKLGIKNISYGPGDRLTLLYVFHPTIDDAVRENLLAARSLIYTKIVEKEELTDDLESYPHLRDESACIQKVNRLSLEDCRNLFPDLRRTRTSEARKILGEYVARYKG
jgi:hypothetical protein